VRYRIEEVGPDGEPLAPDDVKKKFVKACGTLVRDNIPITIREWMQLKDPTISFVCDTMKYRLWNMLMHNFLLRMPEVDNPAQEAAARLDLEARVKKFALIKMAEKFKNWKKNLYLKFVKLDKTLDFEHGYGKIREQWDDFVAYKKSEHAQQRSEINQTNAAKKIYHHKMGPAGYAGCMPRWEAIEAKYFDAGITPTSTKQAFGFEQRQRHEHEPVVLAQ